MNKVSKRTSVLEAIKQSVDLITGYIVDLLLPGRLDSVFSDRTAWILKTSSQLSRLEASITHQRKIATVDKYSVKLEEVWNWTRSHGQEPTVSTSFWLIFSNRQTDKHLRVRFTPLPLDQEINEQVAAETANREPRIHTLFYGGHDRQLLTAMKQYHGPVLRIEFNKYWGPKVKDDIVAQLCVEVLQSEFSQSYQVRGFLIDYVTRVMTKTDAKDLPNQEQLIDEVADDVVRNWTIPIHTSAFRHYVLYTMSGKAKQQKRSRFDDLATYLGVSRATLYRWISKGKIPGVTVNRAIGKRPPDYFFGQPIQVKRFASGRNQYQLNIDTLDVSAIEQLKNKINADSRRKDLIKRYFDLKKNNTRRSAQQWVARRLSKGFSLEDIEAEVSEMENFNKDL